MNRLKLLAVLFVLVLLAVPMYTQVAPVRTTVNVPFEFMAGDTILPAGDYSVVCVTQNVLKLTGPDGSIFVMVQDKIAPEEIVDTKLVFTQQNGKHVLHQVWTAGQDHAHDVIHASATLDVP